MNDTWYRATTPFYQIAVVDNNGTTSGQITYRPDEAASPLGCTEKFQYCFGNVNTCGPLASFYDAASGAYKLTGLDGVNDNVSANQDASRLAWFIYALQTSQISVSGHINNLGPDPLVSTQTLDGGIQLPLPLNQWQIDIKHVWAISQAYLQQLFVEVTHGRSDPDLAAYKLLPSNSAQQQMCNNQKIRSTDYTSFNFFALLFTYILGIIIVVISFSLEPCLEYMHREWKYQTYAQLEWTTNSTLQLHRLAHDRTYDKALTWSHCVNTIPTTSPGVNLAGLDVGDIKHPMLNTQANSTDSGTIASSHTPEEAYHRPSSHSSQILDEVDQNHRPSSSSSQQMSSTALPIEQDYTIPHLGESTLHVQYPVQLQDDDTSANSADQSPVSSGSGHHGRTEQAHDVAPPDSAAEPSRYHNSVIPCRPIANEVLGETRE